MGPIGGGPHRATLEPRSSRVALGDRSPRVPTDPCRVTAYCSSSNPFASRTAHGMLDYHTLVAIGGVEKVRSMVDDRLVAEHLS